MESLKRTHAASIRTIQRFVPETISDPRDVFNSQTPELARKTSLMHDTSRVLHQSAIEALGHPILRRRMWRGEEMLNALFHTDFLKIRQNSSILVCRVLSSTVGLETLDHIAFALDPFEVLLEPIFDL